MKKKIILVGLIVIMLGTSLITLTGCGNKKEENSTKNKSTQQNTQNKTNTTTSDRKKVEYDYKEGVLTQIVDENGNPKQTKFVIDGVILIGNQHSYPNMSDTDSVINNFVKHGYKKEGINSSFYLNEHIEIYLDTKYTGPEDDVRMYITPHKTVEEYEKMTITELFDLADEKGALLHYKKPDEENYKFVEDPYINLHYPEGKYDILFLYRGNLAYFITINVTKN